MIFIWDFNGTIIDDIDICLKAENQLAKKYNKGRQITRKEYLDLFEFPVYNYYVKVGYDLKKYDFSEISKEFIELYKSYSDEYKLNDGVLDILKRSKSQGNKNIIISASEQKILNQQVKMLGLSNYFHDIVGIEDVEAASKKETALKWLKKNNYNKDEMIFIGDSTHDYEVAEAMGIKSLLVAAGHMSKERLLEVTPNVIDSFEEFKYV